MAAMAQDVKYAFRMLVRNPGFTLVAILTLALGIGANTAIFSIIDALLLEPLPFKNPAQLVSLRETESAPGDYPIDGADYLDWRAQNKTFSSMSLYTFLRGYNASGMGETESASAVATEASFFHTLGIEPVIGRVFAKGEDQGTHRLVVLTYGFWQRHFGGTADALGKTVQLDDQPYTVIGVTPRWLNFPADADLFVPVDMTSADVHDRGSHWAQAIGRVKDGVSVAQARADLLTVSARLNQQYRAPSDQDIHSLVYPLKERLTGGSRAELLILFGAVALVLLVACANIANLLLARSTGRVREMAVRAALGAGRWQLARQLLTESVLLALCGATLGILAAWWGVSILQSAETIRIPRVNPVQVNLTVLLFAIAVSVLVGILFGLAPAMRSSQLDLSEELKSRANVVSGASSGSVLRSTLMVAEIAVSLALLVGAGLLMRSFAQMRSTNIGVRPNYILTMRVNLPVKKYDTVVLQRGFFDQLLERIQQVPGVTAAAVSTHLPLQGGSNGYVNVPGNTNPALKNQLVEVHWITPDYFRVFGIPLIEGRTFTNDDAQRVIDTDAKAMAAERAANGGTPKFPPGLAYTVIINQAMAKAFWPNQDPIGKEFTGEGGGVPWTVVGVVGDVKQFSVREKAAPERYYPLTGAMGSGGVFYGFGASVVVKTAVAPTSVLGAIQKHINDLDGTLAVFDVRTMNEVIANSMQDATVQTFLLGVFAALALALAAVGLYGVTSYLVTRRKHEIGIRMALGAQTADVLRMVILQGAKLIALGVVIGAGGALALTRLLAASLFGVAATDPATYASVAGLLAVVALAACYIPARRATRVDPMVALRYE